MYFVHGTRLADCFARNIAILISRSTVVGIYAASKIIVVKSCKCAELFAPETTPLLKSMLVSFFENVFGEVLS